MNHFPPPARPDALPETIEIGALRSARFVAPRRRWPGVLAAGALGAAIAAVAVSSFYDDRSIGQRLDAGVDAAGRTVQARVDGMKEGASEVASQGVATGERLVASLADAGITASVKTALAADPELSALQIEVDTRDGIVTLAGPAPDAQARERAAMMAAAPEGVRSVDNRLVVASSGGLR